MIHQLAAPSLNTQQQSTDTDGAEYGCYAYGITLEKVDLSMSRSKSISLQRGEISRRGYSAVRPAEVLRQRSGPLTAGPRIFEISTSINTHTSSLSLRACTCFLVFVFPPSSPLFVPAAFTSDQLSVPWPSAVAILVGIRGRLRLRPGRLYVRMSI